MRFYKEIKITSYEMLSNLFTEIHSCNSNLGVYFDTINLARVFADNMSCLSTILPGHTVLETPAETKHVQCKRCYDQDRNTEKARIKRLTTLRQRFGEEFDSERVSSRNYKPHYYVNLKSKSTGRTFRLNVRNRVKKQQMGSFTSYGLSINGSTVPLF